MRLTALTVVCSSVLLVAGDSGKRETARDRLIEGSCKAAEALGIDMKKFAHDIAHGVHILTVEDVRYFLDEPNFTEDNDIPTMNPDLIGTPVQYKARSIPSEFEFPAGRVLDFAFSFNDRKKNWIIEGSNTLEIIAHAAHMHEMLMDTGNVYKKIRESPPENINDVCPCLVDDSSNCVLAYHYVLSKLDELGTEVNPDPAMRGVRPPGFDPHLPELPPRCGTFLYGDTKPIPPYLDGIPTFNMTGGIYFLTDPKSWFSWKVPMIGRNLSFKEAFNTAMYLYCKINFKWKSEIYKS